MIKDNKFMNLWVINKINLSLFLSLSLFLLLFGP